MSAQRHATTCTVLHDTAHSDVNLLGMQQDTRADHLAALIATASALILDAGDEDADGTLAPDTAALEHARADQAALPGAVDGPRQPKQRSR